MEKQEFEFRGALVAKVAEGWVLETDGSAGGGMAILCRTDEQLLTAIRQCLPQIDPGKQWPRE